jgi:His/Glu/Gln/Arg/opine family amino acid ABC transporter permease subunit
MINLDFTLSILYAVKITLGVSILALCVGLCLGLLGAFCEKQNTFLGLIFKTWHLLVRGLPEIFTIFVIYFGATLVLSKVFGHYVGVSAFESGVLALGLIFGAYSSQIILAALKAIPKGQKESAQVLGLSHWQLNKNIILPQMWKLAWPGLFNLWLVLLKDSSIVSLIGLHDILDKAHIAASETFQPFTYYCIAAGLYLILTYLSQIIGKIIKSGLKLEVGHVSAID